MLLHRTSGITIAGFLAAALCVFPGIASGLKLMELDYVDDDVVDIDPDTGQKTLVFRWKVATGQFTGDITGTGNVVSKGAGDCDCAQVTLSASSIVASCLK